MDEKRERRWIPGEKADSVKELVEIINQEERDDQLAEKLSAYHENDIAEAFELLDEKGRRKLYRVLDTEWMSEVFAYLDDVGTYLEELEADDAADIIENMDADDAVDVLQEVDDNVREKLVSDGAYLRFGHIHLLCRLLVSLGQRLCTLRHKFKPQQLCKGDNSRRVIV